MAERALWEVCPVGFGMFGWKVTVLRKGQKRKQEAWFAHKALAIEYATSACRFWWKSMKEPAELIIKNRTGVISNDKRTYGEDPKGNG